MLGYDFSNLSIMVVDDYMPMRAILRGVLLALGVGNVADAANGRDALEQLKSFNADIVILDNMMEQMNGIELTYRIRGGEGGTDPFIPIIMISGYSELNYIMEARDAGVSEFLAKPISAKLVFLRLRTVIEKPRSFVRTQDFFGPDRRRRPLEIEQPERRDSPYEYDGTKRQEERPEE